MPLLYPTSAVRYRSRAYAKQIRDELADGIPLVLINRLDPPTLAVQATQTVPRAQAARAYTIARSAMNNAIRTAQESTESAAMTSSARPRGRCPSASVVSLCLRRFLSV